MKRICFIICIVLLGTLAGFAQAKRGERSNNPDDTLRYLASKINQNWFISANTSVNWWQGSDRNHNGMYTKLNGPTVGGGVAVGKWITHNIALRLTYDVNRAHSFIDGLHTSGSNYQFLYNDNPAPDANGYYTTTFMYHNLHGDVVLSPIDLILGYYNNRFCTPKFIFGMGLACVSEHLFVMQTLLGEGWNKNRNFELSFNAGFSTAFKLNNHIDLDLTAMMSGQEYHIDSWYNEYGSGASSATGSGPRPRFADFNYTLAAGLTWNLSGSDEYGNRIYELPYNYSDEMKSMRKRINDLEDELDDCLKNSQNQEQVIIHDTIFQFGSVSDTITEIVSFPFSIFFHLDSYQLMSRRDVVNMREIARVAMEKGWKIRLRGSCDSATATPEYNQRLSENRCNKIKLEMMDLGVPESQFILVPVGGVHELDPTEYDRRVLIELVKELK